MATTGGQAGRRGGKRPGAGRPKIRLDQNAVRIAVDLAITRIAPVRAGGLSGTPLTEACQWAIDDLRGDLASVVPYPADVVLAKADTALLMGAVSLQRGDGVRRLARRLAARGFGVSEDWLRRNVQLPRPLQSADSRAPAFLPPVIESDPAAFARRIVGNRPDGMRRFARAWNRVMRDPVNVEHRRSALAAAKRQATQPCLPCLREGESPALCQVHAKALGSTDVFYCEECATPIAKPHIGAYACSAKCRTRLSAIRHGRP